MGTIAILIGAFLFTSKIAFKPEIRRLALISYLFCNAFWIPWGILLISLNLKNGWGMLLVQIILSVINTRGLINLRSETNDKLQS